jgi:hypothetical protein
VEGNHTLVCQIYDVDIPGSPFSIISEKRNKKIPRKFSFLAPINSPDLARSIDLPPETSDIAPPNGLTLCKICNTSNYIFSRPGIIFPGIPRESDYLSISGNDYHSHCFVCSTCNQPMTGRVGSKNGRFYCEEHYKV